MSDESHTDTPTVVLVHGAFADGSSWSGVIERLNRRGVKVTAPANPLRGIEFDSAYTASILRRLRARSFVVGHSYGGAVISNAAEHADNVVGLVYVAAFAPDEGERFGEVEAGSKDSVLNAALVPMQYPTADGGSATEFAIDPVQGASAFAGDLSDEQAALIAAVQRPVAEAAFSEPNGPAGMEAPSVVGRCCHRRQGRRDRRRPLDGGAGGRDDHRGRRLARDHGLAARCRRRRDPRGGGRRRRAGRSGGLRCRSRPPKRPPSRAAPSARWPRSRPECSTSATSMSVPADGPAVLLLHGWPYDIHAFAEVAPILVANGHRVIVPHLRGYGSTRFLSDDTARNGEQAALAVDAVALLDALEIDRAVVAGFDWGARTADILAALWPERCSGLVSVSGYLIGSQAAGRQPLPPEAELQWWYQFYFATERGRVGYERNRREFAKLIWRTASPRWDFDEATFDRSAASFDNPDHVDDRDPQLPLAARARRRRTAATSTSRRGSPPAPPITVPTITHGGRRERCTPSRAERLRREVLRPLRAPDDRWRHRPQPAPGGAAGVRRRDPGGG